MSWLPLLDTEIVIWNNENKMCMRFTLWSPHLLVV